MSVNPENWDVDFAFPDFNLAWFDWERSWCRNWIVTFLWKRIWSVFENFNADHTWRREWTGRYSRGFPRKNQRANPSTMTTNLPWKATLPFAVFFFTRTNEGKMETTSRKTLPDFPKYSSVTLKRLNFQHSILHYIKELKHTALLVLTK